MTKSRVGSFKCAARTKQGTPCRAWAISDRDYVQRGMASGALEHGYLMEHSEQLIGHFQALTREAIDPY